MSPSPKAPRGRRVKVSYHVAAEMVEYVERQVAAGRFENAAQAWRYITTHGMAYDRRNGGV